MNRFLNYALCLYSSTYLFFWSTIFLISFFKLFSIDVLNQGSYGFFFSEKSNQKPHINYNLIPGVVYTWPEVAAVGKTEDELKEAGIAYKAGQFPMRALGRSRASMDTDGFVKILADATTDEVLGVHMIGARCADLITEAVTAMEFRASAEDIARMSHAHPTYAEAVKEAALAATEDRPLHI